MLEIKRDKLGQLSSIESFRAIVEGMTDALGDKATAVALTSAGRKHGKEVAAKLGFNGSEQNLDDAAKQITELLGEKGSRLCIIDRIVRDGDSIKVYALETLCAIGGTEESPPKCTFTLGLVWGVLGELLQSKLKASQTESVLRGDSYDLFEFTILT
ncbi:MAG: hydrocarbon-binding protein [Coleofasciculus chthonoplastes F3-SA18-01]|jgi:predicted hydrocarbon binding protein|uniref:hydrocarbon-binding protein n=1 Tax=Coleofasciculus chthonoplastes TaxID=64178 RepID=UPI0032FC6588